MTSETSLPGAPFIHYSKQQLCIENVLAADLVQQYGSPLFVYSKAAIIAAFNAYQQALKDHAHLVCYSVKANSNLAILQLLAKAGSGFDIVSGGELQRVLASGGDPKKIIFSGVGKTAPELEIALQKGIKCFNVESLEEIDTLARVAQSLGKIAPISLRVNPDVDPKTHPYISTGLKHNKFGIAFDQALTAYQHAAQQPSLQIVGIDCHIGSQITEAQPYLDAIDRLAELVRAIESANITLKHLDLGGGLGIQYENAPTLSANDLYTQVLHKFGEHQLCHLELIIEPGRSIVGNAGILLTQVLYLKTNDAKKFCIVDAAMNDLARPAIYDAYHQIVTTSQNATGTADTYDVVGPICESSDWLGRERNLAVTQGSLLAILSAGAYGMTMSSNYNSRPRAAEILVDGNHVHLIRRRETIEELFAHESLIQE